MVKRYIKFTVYKDKHGEFRWRATHGNGKIIADSAEGYSKRGSAFRAANALVTAIQDGLGVVADKEA